MALGGVFHLSINQQISEDHCLSNRDVREAISLAIDRSEINERALLGISPPVIGYFYTGQPLDVGILPNGGAQDLEAAKALMAGTPWADGGCSFTVTTYGAAARIRRGNSGVRRAAQGAQHGGDPGRPGGWRGAGHHGQFA